MIWTEKYRPSKLDEIVGQENVVKSLKAYVATGSIPHLLFAGPAGTGKTTCAIAIAKELYGEKWKESFAELNASDERGLDVVRNRIKNFARTAPIGDAPFKIIFLDEADALTPDAQAALRRIMERYTATCRFILSCNYSSKIIEPIQSRCVVFRFSTIKAEDMEKYVRRIAEKEGIKIKPDGMASLIYVANGDMRKAINVLQVASNISGEIGADDIYKVTSALRPENARELLEIALIKKDFLMAREKLDKMLIEDGLSGEDIIKGLHSAVFDLPINERLKAEIVDRIGEIEFRIVEGSNERIQLEALIAYLISVSRK
ncbi:MAG: replication factor C small subunit [Thermoplasmatales archaeon]|nr:replication factor C small subunit [Thermoplasmatales archaeon]